MQIMHCTRPLCIRDAWDQCLSGLTALVNVKIIENNQIKVGGVYCSQQQSAISSTKSLKVERQRGKMEAANHLLLVNLLLVIIGTVANQK